MRPSFLLARVLATTSVTCLILAPVAAVLYPPQTALAWLAAAWAFGMVARAEARSVRRERREWAA